MSESLLGFSWPLPRAVRAAFTTRLGGGSVAPWDSFNLGAHVGDSAQAVTANRARLADLLELPAQPAWLNQVHGVAVADLDLAPPAPGPLTADAVVTSGQRPCVIMVADCLPVLFAARDGRRIGAAHAGWRGLAGGVLENTVAALAVPGSALTAWLGPAILQPNFEVGAEVRQAFVRDDSAAEGCFEANARGRWQANLVGLARRRLERLGITDIHGGDWCTFADRQRFFSHRRDGHLADGKGGRMAALIWKHGS